MSGLLLGIALATSVAAQTESDPASALEQAIAAAETQLQNGALAAAESRYREALFEGWVLRATLERLDGQWPEAQEALRNASLFRVESPESLRSLAGLELQTGEASRAVEILTEVAAGTPRDPETLRLLAKALAAAGQLEAAVAKLDEASAAASDDPEQTFLVATEYLWLKKVEAAERLFARVVATRPISPTRVLIGRSYRDAGEYARATTELGAAIAQDPGVRRAHYYLGMVLLAEATTSPDRLEKAIAEFQAELKLAPQDPLANDQLGLALLDAGRPAEALPALQIAVREEPRARYLQHLGRAQLALDRPAEAVASSRRALEVARAQGVAGADLEKIHYQLGLALRKLGATAEAATHLAEAREVAARTAEKAREAPAGATNEASPLADLPPAQREELRRRVKEGLARAYFNLGVLQTQIPSRASPAERFARAAAFLERAAAVDPGFPQVQGSLGVAYFNARRFDKAAGPLEQAVAANPADAGLKRMLALALINTRAYEKAVPLLQDDPQRPTDASLQMAYGLALLRSRRAAEAEKVLDELIAQQGDTAELLVLVGEAQAEQKKYELAIASLQRALRLSPDDASVHDQLGHAYQKLGRTELANQQFEASRQLRAKP